MTDISEEELNSIKKKAIKFLENHNKKLKLSDISINIEKFPGGLNNDNYKIIIKEKDSQKLLNEYFIKIFKNQIENKKLESEVQRILGEKNLGPKVLELNDEEKYRIDEYLPNIAIIELEDTLKDNVIDNILDIILGFNNLYHICHYNIDKNYKIKYIENKSLINNSKDKIEIDFKINSFCKHIDEYLPKGELMLNKFIESYSKTKSQSKKEINLDSKIKDLKYYVDNYKSYIVENVYNTEGYFIFSHSDFHRGNIVSQNNNLDKLYVLDNEFINLNLIGYDLMYYLIKSLFGLKGITENYLDLPKFYKIYLKYINKLLNEYVGFKTESSNLLDVKKYIENTAASKEYFIRLIKLVLLFDIIYCCDLINFENEFLNEKPIFGFFNYLYLNIEVLKMIEEFDLNKI